MRLAFDNPVADPSKGGRPPNKQQVVQKLVVFQEEHEDGEPHFHVAVLLASERRWLAAKRTLRLRDKLPSHFSASHSQFWSAVRYGAIATCQKPIVDEHPFQWSLDGLDWSLFETAQEPWTARCWRKRGEQAERKRLCGESQGKAKFSKLDLTAVIIDKKLKSSADVLAYAQDHGTQKMQEWVCQNQRKLPDFVQEAFEWEAARETSKLDKETEWALLCRMADQVCHHGPLCGYAAAAEQFFVANALTLDGGELAATLRAIIMSGPSKTTRCPFLVGPSNSGKTTLLLPFDDLFGHARVFHKPALSSTFPLVNLSKNKRFLFFDDFRPVEYAQGTIDVGTFLSLFNGHPFEIRQSQAFKHGNEDFAWQKGCCLTAKEKELWEPWGVVSPEDVQHMKNRMRVFTCTAVLKDLRRTQPCVSCMCKWIRDKAAQADARAVTQPTLLQNHLADDSRSQVIGFADVCSQASVPPEKARALEVELLQLGAICVREVCNSDWHSLGSFNLLLPFEKRRFLAALAQHCAS